jgi:hypothetical protein
MTTAARTTAPGAPGALLRRGALAALLLALLAGCSAGGSGAAGPSPTAVTNDQILAIGREAAQCMRSHGIPDFPDPTIDGAGHLALPNGAQGEHVKEEMQANPAALQACEPILDRLPPAARGGGSEGPVSQEDMAKLLQFAQCVRQHGVPEWPDPKSDGTFPLSGTPLATEGKSPRLVSAWLACKQYWDKGIQGS